METPLIERPDEHVADAVEEVYCWTPGNADRECNGSCVAFDERYLQDRRFSSCMLINTFKSIGLSMGIKANIMKTESKRMPTPPIPEVR